jgi:hypothetical protein
MMSPDQDEAAVAFAAFPATAGSWRTETGFDDLALPTGLYR